MTVCVSRLQQIHKCLHCSCVKGSGRIGRRMLQCFPTTTTQPDCACLFSLFSLHFLYVVLSVFLWSNGISSSLLFLSHSPTLMTFHVFLATPWLGAAALALLRAADSCLMVTCVMRYHSKQTQNTEHTHTTNNWHTFTQTCTFPLTYTVMNSLSILTSCIQA